MAGILGKEYKKEKNEMVTTCHQLKLKSSDEKHYKTDVVDIERMFCIIGSIPSRNVEPIKNRLYPIINIWKNKQLEDKYVFSILINNQLVTICHQLKNKKY